MIRSPSSVSLTSPPSERSIAAVEVIRSLSLSLSLPALYILVVPSANAAMTASAGTRSGMSAASMSEARSLPFSTLIEPPSKVTFPPKRLTILNSLKSPWRVDGSMPFIVTSPFTAAATAKNAACEQSPSTANSVGLNAPVTA